MECPSCRQPVLAVDAEVDPQRILVRLRAQCGHEIERDMGVALWRSGMRWSVPVVDGISLGAAERYRQVHEEGFTAEHDAGLQENEIAWAAWCLIDAAVSGKRVDQTPSMWPEGAGEWKVDHTPLRRMVIAVAMLAAEIDARLLDDRREQGA